MTQIGWHERKLKHGQEYYKTFSLELGTIVQTSKNFGLVPGTNLRVLPIQTYWKSLSLSITAFRLIGREFQTLCWNLLYVSWTPRGIVESTFHYASQTFHYASGSPRHIK